MAKGFSYIAPDRGAASQEVAQYGEHQQRIDEYYQNPPDVHIPPC